MIYVYIFDICVHIACKVCKPTTRALRSQLELSRRFEGFRSRCSTLAECMYLRARST